MSSTRRFHSRRGWLKASLALGLASLAHGEDRVPAAAAEDAPGPGKVREPARDLDLRTDAEVIVCGAGPAGVTAAIAAARAGAKVRLFETHGALGGVWTSSLLGFLLDFDKPGFNQELVRRLRAVDAIRGTGMNHLCYHPEEMKVVLEELCASAGVTTQLHTRVVAAHRDGRALTSIMTESKSGRQAWGAKVFIDATGDGDLGAQAGCAFAMGEAQGCPCQPLSMDVLLVAKDADALKPFIANHRGDAREALHRELGRAGIVPSYGLPTLFAIRGNLLLAMMNHEYGVDATDAAQVSAATFKARAELHRMVRGLRSLGGGWDGLQIVATPEQIGIRDGRRIVGRYLVTKDDLVTGARQDDAVVRATYPVDIHALTRKANETAAWSDAGVKVKPYDIPLRALIAKDVDGLMMAGRCISGDFIAHASYRVTGNAVAMGEAAGVTAALAARSGRPPHAVAWSEVLPVLDVIRKQG